VATFGVPKRTASFGSAYAHLRAGLGSLHAIVVGVEYLAWPREPRRRRVANVPATCFGRLQKVGRQRSEPVAGLLHQQSARQSYKRNGQRAPSLRPFLRLDAQAL